MADTPPKTLPDHTLTTRVLRGASETGSRGHRSDAPMRTRAHRGLREVFGRHKTLLLTLALLELAGGADPWRAVPLEFAMRRDDIRAAAAVHAEAAPSSRAGRWVRADASIDWLTTGHSPQHLACLDTERQGNCYNDSANMQAADEAKRSRHQFMSQGATIRNSADVLAGRNEWAWRAADSTNRSTRALYTPLSMSRGELEIRLRAFLDEGSRFHVIGDSMSRQFAKSLECTLRHKLGVDDDAPVVVYRPTNRLKRLRHHLRAVRKRDVVVLNIGLHVDPAKGKGFRHGDPPHWLRLYALALQHLFEALGEVGSSVTWHVRIASFSTRSNCLKRVASSRSTRRASSCAPRRSASSRATRAGIGTAAIPWSAAARRPTRGRPGRALAGGTRRSRGRTRCSSPRSTRRRGSCSTSRR